MKAAGHPVPSGDREIARLTLRALDLADFDPFEISDLRIYDGRGETTVQADIERLADAEVQRLLSRYLPKDSRLATSRPEDAPALWYTYHCYYKAPDLIGPAVSQALGIPYVISEPSISPKRRDGPWAAFAAASEAAIVQADRLFWTTVRDRPALDAAGLSDRMVNLPAFLDPGAEVPPRPAHVPVRLLTVAMMRPGDKFESYRRLADALAAIDQLDWRLDIYGDGPVRAEIEALLAPFAGQTVFHGIADASTIRAASEAADVFVWPGVGEGVGMAYLEAQAAGLPVVAEDHPAQAGLVHGLRMPPSDAAGFARAISRAATDREQMGRRARAAIVEQHSLEHAASILRAELRGLL